MTKLRIEISENCSGNIENERLIKELKEKNYYVLDIKLDGDAPKQFIKAYFYEEDSGIRKNNPKTWFPYIAKAAEKWYPHESVIEFMINRIGEEMGLKLNEIKLVKANSQIRFLSKYFLKKNEKLIHGAEICGEHLGDMDMAEEIAKHKPTARELFTFEFIKEAIHSVFPASSVQILRDLVKMIAFDAIVGNNDRHFYNWGVIDTKKKTRKSPEFAPIYDTARGLLWNFSDENIVNHYKNYYEGGKKIMNYIESAYPRISIEGNSNVNHFDLIKIVKEDNIAYRNIVNELANADNEEKVLKMLEKEFYPFFIAERRQLIEIILRTRFKRIREI
jgi:hypothetical protein